MQAQEARSAPAQAGCRWGLPCGACGGRARQAPPFEELSTEELIQAWVRFNVRVSTELLRREQSRQQAESEADAVLNELLAEG